jgi:hypothetical protein
MKTKIRHVGSLRRSFAKIGIRLSSLCALLSIWWRMPPPSHAMLDMRWHGIDGRERQAIANDVVRRLFTSPPVPRAVLHLNTIECRQRLLTIRRLREGWCPSAGEIAEYPLADDWHLIDHGDHFNLSTEEGEQLLFWLSGRQKLALTEDGWLRLGMRNVTSTDLMTIDSDVDERAAALLQRTLAA